MRESNASLEVHSANLSHILVEIWETPYLKYRILHSFVSFPRKSSSSFLVRILVSLCVLVLPVTIGVVVFPGLFYFWIVPVPALKKNTTQKVSESVSKKSLRKFETDKRFWNQFWKKVLEPVSFRILGLEGSALCSNPLAFCLSFLTRCHSSHSGSRAQYHRISHNSEITTEVM